MVIAIIAPRFFSFYGGMPTIQSIQLFSLVKMLWFWRIAAFLTNSAVHTARTFPQWIYFVRCREQCDGDRVIYMLHNDDTVCIFSVQAQSNRREKWAATECPFIVCGVVCVCVCVGPMEEHWLFVCCTENEYHASQLTMRKENVFVCPPGVYREATRYITFIFNIYCLRLPVQLAAGFAGWASL